MLGRLLYIPFGSMLTLGRLGDAALPTYRIYQTMHDACGGGVRLRSPVERVTREAVMQSSTSCDAASVILQIHVALAHPE